MYLPDRALHMEGSKEGRAVLGALPTFLSLTPDLLPVSALCPDNIRLHPGSPLSLCQFEYSWPAGNMEHAYAYFAVKEIGFRKNPSDT